MQKIPIISGSIDYTEDARIIPHDEIRAGTLAAIQSEGHAEYAVEIEHNAPQGINIDRYCCYVYPHFSTARVMFREHDHGRMEAEAKRLTWN